MSQVLCSPRLHVDAIVTDVDILEFTATLNKSFNSHTNANATKQKNF